MLAAVGAAGAATACAARGWGGGGGGPLRRGRPRVRGAELSARAAPAVGRARVRRRVPWPGGAGGKE